MENLATLKPSIANISFNNSLKEVFPVPWAPLTPTTRGVSDSLAFVIINLSKGTKYLLASVKYVSGRCSFSINFLIVCEYSVDY